MELVFNSLPSPAKPHSLRPPRLARLIESSSHFPAVFFPTKALDLAQASWALHSQQATLQSQNRLSVDGTLLRAQAMKERKFLFGPSPFPISSSPCPAVTSSLFSISHFDPFSFSTLACCSLHRLLPSSITALFPSLSCMGKKQSAQGSHQATEDNDCVAVTRRKVSRLWSRTGPWTDSVRHESTGGNGSVG